MSKKCKIILVDDDADIVSVIKRGLEMKGFEVDSFTDPLAALAGFKQGEHDLLLSDVRMPGMSGIQLFKEIRKIDDKVKVLFLTAFEIQDNEWQKVLPDVNASAFINKPVELRQLMRVIQDLKESVLEPRA